MPENQVFGRAEGGSDSSGAVNQEMLEQLLAALNAPKKV